MKMTSIERASDFYEVSAIYQAFRHASLLFWFEFVSIHITENQKRMKYKNGTITKRTDTFLLFHLIDCISMKAHVLTSLNHFCGRHICFFFFSSSICKIVWIQFLVLEMGLRPYSWWQLNHESERRRWNVYITEARDINTLNYPFTTQNEKRKKNDNNNCHVQKKSEEENKIWTTKSNIAIYRRNDHWIKTIRVMNHNS